MTSESGPAHLGIDAEVVSIYDTKVDREGPESAHTAALELVGWNKRVLEVGCAGGHVTTALVEQGCTVVGVEIDPRAAAAAERVAEKVVVGDIDAGEIWAGLEGEQFDVVLLGDVLEHLRDPLEALRRFTTHLGPEGLVVISLPNIAHGDVRLSLLGGEFAYRPTGLLDRTHLHFFTHRTALELLEQAGLVPVATRRIVMPLFTSELAVPRHHTDPSVVAAILEDPDAETYQFVFAAVRDTGDVRLRRALARLPCLEEELRRTEVRLAVARAESAEAERTSAELRGERDAAVLDASRVSAAVESERAAWERSRNELAVQVAETETRSASTAAELAALQSTRTFRWSQTPRRLYGRLRRPSSTR